MYILMTYFNLFDNLNIYLKISIQAVLIIFFTFFLSKLFKSLLFLVFKYFVKTNSIIDNSIIVAVKKPIFYFMWLYAFLVSTDLFIEQFDGKLLKYTSILKYSITYISILSFFIRSITQFKSHYIIQKEKMHKNIDYGTVDTIVKLSKVIVFMIWVIVVLGKMGFNLSALLAFGGAGGVVVGFAGKDLFTNIFGGLILYWDKPFSVGDWIASPDKSIEGDVEEIGWRQTRILTFEKYPIYVPNSIFGNIIIENKSRCKARRIKENIKIRFLDLTRVDRITNDIMRMLKEHFCINKKFPMYINFVKFDEDALNLLVSTYTNTSDYFRYLEIKQEILLKIAEIIKENGADVALPTTNLYINRNTEQKSNLDLNV